MDFLRNFEEFCRKRGESPSHALEAVGLSRSAYGKWKKNPDLMPTSKTVDLLAKYFGCTYEQLIGRSSGYTGETDYIRFINQCAKMTDRDFNYLLSFCEFTWPDIFRQ